MMPGLRSSAGALFASLLPIVPILFPLVVIFRGGYAYIKSTHWSYEREWRVWYPYSHSTGPYDPVLLGQSEFAALYFGCRADPDFVSKATDLMRLSFPNIRAFKAHRKEREYALEYAEI